MTSPRWLAKKKRASLDLEAVRYRVYWCFDADSTLLYVGRSCEVATRVRDHELHAEWGRRIAIVQQTELMTWRQAVDAERAAIIAGQPLFNKEFITHNAPKSAT